MPATGAHDSVDFFDRQFHRQVAGQDFQLNPFEREVLPQRGQEIAVESHESSTGRGRGHLRRAR